MVWQYVKLLTNSFAMYYLKNAHILETMSYKNWSNVNAEIIMMKVTMSVSMNMF